MVHYEPLSHKLAAEKECTIEVCMEREARRKKTYHAPKEIYSKALEGKAPIVSGMGHPYEPPLNPEVTIDTAQHTPSEPQTGLLTSAIRFVKRYITRMFCIGRKFGGSTTIGRLRKRQVEGTD